MNAMAGPSQTVVLVRHGETPWSKAGKHTGRTDIELTDEGRVAAESLRPKLAGRQFAAVFTSPLVRARATCELAGFGAQAVVVNDLAEWDYGNVEGRTTAEMRVDTPNWSIWREGPVGGETLAEVAARADRVIARMQSVGGDVACFAHGHLLRILAVRWMGADARFAGNLALGPTSISTLGFASGLPAMLTWNT